MKPGLFITAIVLFLSTACAVSQAAPVSSQSTSAPAALPVTPATALPSIKLTPTIEIFIPPDGFPDVTPTPARPAVPESRRLVLEYPPRMKANVEGDIIRLTLEVDDLGNMTPTAEFAGNVVTGEIVQIPDLYETHLITAEARLDMAGMNVQPSGSTFEPLKPGLPVTFYWSIRPQEVGTYRGTAWLHLNFQEISTGEKSRVAVSAQIVEVEAVDFFGFSFNAVRATGVLGSVLGGMIGFPFLEDILRFVFKKRKQKMRTKIT